MNYSLTSRKQKMLDPLEDFLNSFLNTASTPLLDHEFRYPSIFDRTNTSVEVYETDSEHKIEIAVPGLVRENLTASLDDRVLTVSYKTDEKEESNVNYKYRSNSFSRSWKVPESTKPEDVDAEYKDGILVVSVKKTEPEKNPTYEIEIK
tara:strand:- start:3138 stop:3584 length:447 start_codon:yes stop_codon:yes gene_type:complete